MADDHHAHAQRLDGTERWSTENRWKEPGARTRFPSPTWQRKPEHVKILEEWMRSYRPEELFDENGKLVPELAELAPKGNRRMGANPHANGGVLLRDLVDAGFSRICGRSAKAGD